MATDVEQLNKPSGEAGSSGKHRKTMASYSMSLHDSGTHSAEISWILCQFTRLCSLYPLAYFWPGWTSNYPSFQAPDAKGASIEELKEKATGFHAQPSLLWSQNICGLIKYVQVCPFNEIRITDRAMSLLRGRRCWGKFPTNVLEPCVICICSQCLWAANSPRQADNSRKAIFERS